MSLQPMPIPAIPEETVRVAKRAFRKGNIFITIGDRIGTLFEDADFAVLYDAEGKPAVAPYLLALVLVFQFMEDLSDREAADAVRARIDWKYALHLALEDEGFDHSVLCDFRSRLLEHNTACQMFDRVLTRLEELGLLRQRGRQRTDSTHVLMASQRLSRLELVRETMRLVLEAMAELEPAWLRAHAQEGWYERYSHPWSVRRLPKSQDKRDALIQAIGEDGFYLLDQVHQEDAPQRLRELEEVAVLSQVWAQQFERSEGGVRSRPTSQRPAGAELIVTPHDTEARRSVHGDHEWHGYRVHWTETCDEDLPRLVTDVQLTPATTPDVVVTGDIQEALASRELLPATHLVDGGYTAGHVIEQSQKKYQVDLVGPVSPDTSWQARTPEGVTVDQFQIDWDAKQATCPQGHRSTSWFASTNEEGQPVLHIRFDKNTCHPCPVRQLCTRNNRHGRSLKVLNTHATIQAARQRQCTAEFRRTYAWRAGAEGTVSVTVRQHGMRRSRYIGEEKTRLQALLTGMALNLKRAALWLMGYRVAASRPSALLCLAPVPV